MPSKFFTALEALEFLCMLENNDDSDLVYLENLLVYLSTNHDGQSDTDEIYDSSTRKIE